MSGSTRLQATQTWAIFYDIFWPGHQMNNEPIFATLSWPDEMVISKIRGPTHPVDDSLAAKYPGLSATAISHLQ